MLARVQLCAQVGCCINLGTREADVVEAWPLDPKPNIQIFSNNDG